MSANYPAALDTYPDTVVLAGKTGSDIDGSGTDLTQLLGDFGNVIEALQAKVGSTSSAVTSSHEYQLAHLPADTQIGAWTSHGNLGASLTLSGAGLTLPRHIGTINVDHTLTVSLLDNEQVFIRTTQGPGAKTISFSGVTAWNTSSGSAPSVSTTAADVHDFYFERQGATTWGEWLTEPASGSGLTDAFAAVTDGTHTATASGSGTFKVRSSDSSVTATVTNDDGTHGDNVDLSVSASNIATGAVPLAHGGTGQTTKAPAFNALSPLTTKGDVATHDGTNSVRLAVGTNGQVLTADSAQTDGVKWATPSGGGGAVASDVIWDAAGDLAVGSGSDTAAKLTLGAARKAPTSDGSALYYSYPAFQQEMMAPTGAVAESFPRAFMFQMYRLATVFTLGTLHVVMVPIRKGTTVTNINFVTGAAGGTTLTHTWGVLCDTDKTILKKSTDNTSATLGTSSIITLPLSSSQLITADGLYPVGLLQAGATACTVVSPSVNTVTAVAGIAPSLVYAADSGLTDPTSLNPGTGKITQGSAVGASCWVYLT